jgi:hypothetical protein
VSAIDTLLELSAGCTDSWDLYLRTRGIDLDVEAHEWGEVAGGIELSRRSDPLVAWAAARRAQICWLVSVGREWQIPPHLYQGPTHTDDVEGATRFLLDEALQDERDVRCLDDDSLRRLWADLSLIVDGTDDAGGEGDDSSLRERCAAAEQELDERGLVPRVLERPADYRGQSRLSVSCSAWEAGDGAPRSRSTAREWITFFSEPRGIVHLSFPFRLPKAVFRALAAQTELRSLVSTWSDIDTLEPLRSLTRLERLTLAPGPATTSLEPIASLNSLRYLDLSIRRGVRDLSPVGGLEVLETLRLSTEGAIDSLSFLRQARSLRHLEFFGRVSGKDHSPLTERPDLDWVRIRPERGMTPTADELAASVPGLVLGA